MRKIKLTLDEIGIIKTIAYHEGVSGGVKVYLQANGEFFDDRHPDYYPEDHEYDDYDDWMEDYACENGCCRCCGCSCWMNDYDEEDDE